MNEHSPIFTGESVPGARPPQSTQVEMFNPSLGVQAELLNLIGAQEVGDMMTQAFLMGGMLPPGKSMSLRPICDAYKIAHVRAGYPTPNLRTFNANMLTAAGPATADCALSSTWEMYRLIDESCSASTGRQGIRAREAAFDDSDFSTVSKAMRDGVAKVVTEKIVWAQIRDSEEQAGRRIPVLDNPQSGFGHVAAHISTTLIEVRAAAVLSGDPRTIAETCSFLQSLRRGIAGDKQTHLAVAQLTRLLGTDLDPSVLNELSQGIRTADANGHGVESIVRAMWCHSLDGTLETMQRLGKKWATEERSQAQAQTRAQFSVFRRPAISAHLHASMEHAEPQYYATIPEVSAEVPAASEDAAGEIDDVPEFVPPVVEQLAWTVLPGSKEGLTRAATAVVASANTRRKQGTKSRELDPQRMYGLQLLSEYYGEDNCYFTHGSLDGVPKVAHEEGQRPDEFVVLVVRERDPDTGDVVAENAFADSPFKGKHGAYATRHDVSFRPWWEIMSMDKPGARASCARMISHRHVQGEPLGKTMADKAKLLFAVPPEKFLTVRFDVRFAARAAAQKAVASSVALMPRLDESKS